MNTEKNKQKWIKMVEETLELGGRSKVTIRNYLYAINHFLNAHGNNTNIAKFNEKNIIKYLKKEYLDKNCKAATYNFYLSSIKFLYSVCFNIEFNNKLLPKAKTAKKLPKIMKKKDFINMINNEKNLEHQCWLILGFCCGLRANEVATLRIENINSKEHRMKVIGKGNKERYTILPNIVIKLLRIYCLSKNIKIKSGYIFKGTNGNEHISPYTIENYFTDYADSLGLEEGISFHTLRHSFATYFLMNDGDQFVLKDMLGHSSLSTTAIYVHLANDFNNLKGINYHGK